MSDSTLTRLIAASRTVRVRTTGGAAALVAIALLLTAWATVFIQEQELRQNLDASLDQRTAGLVGVLKGGPLPADFASREDETFVQLVGGNGRVVAASPNLDGYAPVAGGFRPAGLREARTIDTLQIDDEDHFRVVGQRFSHSDGNVYTLYVGETLLPIDESVALLRRSFLVGTPLLVILVTALTWYFVGRALAPVEAMRAEVADITASELHRRVPAPPTDDEIGRLANTMNEMLARLEESQARQQQFVADASHELRSPLANIRAQLEVDLAHPDQASPLATEQSVLDEAMRLERLADDLLLLARGDSGAPMRAEPVDLDDIIFRETERLRARRGAMVDTVRVSGAQVVGDAELLSRVIRNLLENAARYAAERITVELREDRRSGRIELVVADDGPGVPAEARERIFERFARLDAARGRDVGGAGLGLAIVREIVQRHGGAIEVDVSSEGGARFTVRLPVDRAASQWPAA
ncbi:MAG: ATP-binding protein [Chloroflexi bacterium]|nr:ATP-binding protein [Chloroflexota bacterium]MDA1147955.1 ATP-binding protein [Chloroflexota bacterium]